MSEQVNEPTPQPTPEPTPQPTPEPTPQPTPEPTPQPTPQPSDASIPFQLVKRGTGAMHYVDGGARTDLVRHGETGEPEQEYALVATIDGVEVTLASWNAGRIGSIVRAGQQTRQQQQTTAV